MGSDHGELGRRLLIHSPALASQIVSGLIWTAAGTWGQVLVQFGVIVVLARLLSPADFGLAAAAQLVVTLGVLISQLGVQQAVVQRPELELRHIETGFTLSTVLGLLLGLVVYFSAVPLAMIFRMDGLVPVVQVTALIFPLQGFVMVAEGLLQRELAFRSLAISQTTAQLFGYGMVAIALSLLGWGAMSLAIASVAQTLVQVILLLYLKPHRKRPRLDARAARELLRFGGGSALAKLGNIVANKGDYFVAGRWLGAEALGFYVRAYQLMTLPSTVFGKVLNGVLFPAMARIQQDKHELSRWFIQGSAAIALITVPVSVVFFILAPELVALLLGDGWEATATAFQILSVGILFRSSYKISDSLAHATGSVFRRAWRQWVYAAAVVGGAWVGQHWDIEGVAAGVLAAVFGNFLLMSQLSLSILSMHWRAFAMAHVPSLWLGLAFGVPIFLVTGLLRASNAAAWLTVVAAGAMALIGIVLLARIRPAWLLGKEGVWLAATIARSMRLKSGTS